MKLLNNLKISHKLIIMSLFMVISLLVMSVTFYYTQALSVESSQTSEKYQSISLAVLDLEREIMESRVYEKEFLLNPSEKFIEKFNETISESLLDMKELLEIAEQTELATLITQVRENLKKYNTAFLEVVALQTKNGFDHKSGLLGNLRKSVHKVEKTLNQAGEIYLSHSMLMMRRHEKDFIARGLAKYIKQMSSEYQRFLGLLAESDLLENDKSTIRSEIKVYYEDFLALADNMNAMRVKIDNFKAIVDDSAPPLLSLAQKARELHNHFKQAFDQDIKETELTYYGMVLALILLSVPMTVLLSRSINQSTHRIIQMLQGIAGGEAVLTERLEVRGKDEMAEIAKWFNHLMDKLQDMLEEVSNLANHLTEAAANAQKMENETTTAIYSQVKEIGQIADSIESITASIDQVAENASEASERANEADSSALKGNREVNDAIASIQKLATDIEQAAESVKHIDEYSRSIDSVIAMINGIAEQTNLLALNAAIEAARAGEAGRGFAVVADEVRTLSLRTTASTEEIKSTIANLQQGTSEAVNVMNISQQTAVESVTQAQQAGASIQEITESVASIARLNARMSKAASEQSEAANLINRNIVEINMATKKLSESAQKTMSDSSDLSQTSLMLQMMSKRFGYSEQQDDTPEPKKDSDSTEVDDSVEFF